MTRQTRLERDRLIRLAVVGMDENSRERELSDLYMNGETDQTIHEMGWYWKNISATKRKICQILLDAGIEVEQRKKGNDNETHP